MSKEDEEAVPTDQVIKVPTATETDRTAQQATPILEPSDEQPEHEE